MTKQKKYSHIEILHIEDQLRKTLPGVSQQRIDEFQKSMIDNSDIIMEKQTKILEFVRDFAETDDELLLFSFLAGRIRGVTELKLGNEPF